ncbi:Uncharacterised protein [Mycoplasmopsis citelli]|uniref:Uncharacterized protein n=1 Tax=Mycoplasmopsis citelli TaxID=171281 RepID=A0A449B2N8_9BACT|nr:hypothetical protein [Mycoplasmopsis citelli]VEU74815.1 Uncharacterised protein [Mycoplasmopsis citelli]
MTTNYNKEYLNYLIKWHYLDNDFLEKVLYQRSLLQPNQVQDYDYKLNKLLKGDLSDNKILNAFRILNFKPTYEKLCDLFNIIYLDFGQSKSAQKYMSTFYIDSEENLIKKIDISLKEKGIKSPYAYLIKTAKVLFPTTVSPYFCYDPAFNGDIISIGHAGVAFEIINHMWEKYQNKAGIKKSLVNWERAISIFNISKGTWNFLKDTKLYGAKFGHIELLNILYEVVEQISNKCQKEEYIKQISTIINRKYDCNILNEYHYLNNLKIYILALNIIFLDPSVENVEKVFDIWTHEFSENFAQEYLSKNVIELGEHIKTQADEELKELGYQSYYAKYLDLIDKMKDDQYYQFIENPIRVKEINEERLKHQLLRLLFKQKSQETQK